VATDHIVHPDLLQPSPNLMLQEVVRPESVDVHVPAHADELRTGQVVQGDVVLEELGHADDVFRRGFLSSRSDLRSGLCTISG
jgi:hypothetical protein